MKISILLFLLCVSVDCKDDKTKAEPSSGTTISHEDENQGAVTAALKPDVQFLVDGCLESLSEELKETTAEKCACLGAYAKEHWDPKLIEKMRGAPTDEEEAMTYYTTEEVNVAMELMLATSKKCGFE